MEFQETQEAVTIKPAFTAIFRTLPASRVFDGSPLSIQFSS